MKRVTLRSKNGELLKKVEKALAETVIHRRPRYVSNGAWPFVVFGPDKGANAVIRTGNAQQSLIHSTPVYLATVGGDHIPDSQGIPIEELAAGDVPEELVGLKVFQLSPMRPLTIISKRIGPPIKSAVQEILELHKENDTAIIETPDEAFWTLSVLKYLDESDRFFPDPVLENFYSRLGHTSINHSVH